MKTYYIYHIPTIKIGCTSQLNKRMSDQGFTDWEILEEHTDIYVASDREIELQKEYGLPVDKSPYWSSVENRRKWSKEDGAKGRAAGASRLGGLALKGKPKSEKWKAKKPWLKSHESHMIKTECPYCSKLVDKRNYGRWHGDNCKHKKTLTN